MQITVQQHFDSQGGYRPGGDQEVDRWAEKGSWINQHGRGWTFDVNLIWIALTVEIYCPAREDEVVVRDGVPSEWQTGTVQDFLGLTDEEAADIERRIDELGLLKEEEEGGCDEPPPGTGPYVFPKGGHVSDADIDEILSRSTEEEE